MRFDIQHIVTKLLYHKVSHQDAPLMLPTRSKFAPTAVSVQFADTLGAKTLTAVRIFWVTPVFLWEQISPPPVVPLLL